MKRGQRGQVLVILALSIVALLGLAALAVDVGYLWSIRHQLQRSADAGALAGASRFIPPDTGDWADTIVQSEAEARARDYASRDPVGSSALRPAPAENEIFVSFPQTDRIKVVTQRTVPLFFARVLGRASQLVSAEAVAEARTVSQNVKCIKPWGIPYPWNDADGDGLYDTAEDVYNMCPEGTFIPDNNTFCQGTQIIMKIGTPSGKKDQPDIPSLQQEAGHFFALDFGSGAKTYNDAIKEGCPDESSVSVGDNVTLEPGNMVGPTYQGVTSDSDSLFNQDPTSHWNDQMNLPESDPSGPYHIEDQTWMNSPRVVRIVVYDPRTALSSGKTEIEVATLAGFWIDNCTKDGNQGTVYGRFIPNSAFGETTGPTPGGGGPTLRILSLVK